MSAPDPRLTGTGVRLARAELAVFEWVAFDEAVLRRHATDLGVELAPPQGVARADDGLTLSVRPRRWLLLAPGAPGRRPESPPPQGGAAVELSSAYAVLLVAGAQVRELLARGCRVDLDPRVFPAGRAAATIMAQVSVTLAALPGGFLLLTPATTARYFEEWLEACARPFGLDGGGGLRLEELFGERSL